MSAMHFHLALCAYRGYHPRQSISSTLRFENRVVRHFVREHITGGEFMIRKRTIRVLTVLGLLAIAAVPARAQITTGTVSGTVKDAQGGVVPGATVVLVSESQGTRSNPSVTNTTGDYVFPNVASDTYSVEVSMQGFKTL